MVTFSYSNAPVIQSPKHQDLYKIIKNYKKYKQMCDLTFSGMHWNHNVVIYLNKGSEDYIHNFSVIEFLSDEELAEDFEEEHGEEALQKALIFRKYPVGTIMIKEHYLTNDSSKSPISYAIMIKREKGFNQNSNDWEYAWVAKDNSILLRGVDDSKVVKNTCHNCHYSVKERDFIFGTALKDNFIKK